jgi:S-adenosylmethionine decarboxylase
MAAIGKHIVIDCYGCQGGIAKLDDQAFVKQMLIGACEAANCTVLAYTDHKFQPQGITALVLLAESHVSIHTYLELGYVGVDIFTCGNKAMPDRAGELILKALEPSRYVIKEILRGDEIG